jgi:hypothetical protein
LFIVTFTWLGAAGGGGIGMGSSRGAGGGGGGISGGGGGGGGGGSGGGARASGAGGGGGSISGGASTASEKLSFVGGREKEDEKGLTMARTNTVVNNKTSGITNLASIFIFVFICV